MNLNLTDSVKYNLYVEKGKLLQKDFLAVIVSGDTEGTFDFTAYSAATLVVKSRPNDYHSLIQFSTIDNSIDLGTNGQFTLEKSATAMNLKTGKYNYEMWLDSAEGRRGFLRGQFIVYDASSPEVPEDSVINASPIRIVVRDEYSFQITGTTIVNNYTILTGVSRTTFNTYTGATSTALNGKLDKTVFQVYTGATATALNGKVDKTVFIVYTGATDNRLDALESLTGSSNLSFSNGVRRIGNNVKLGGAITEDTIVSATTNFIVFQGPGSSIDLGNMLLLGGSTTDITADTDVNIYSNATGDLNITDFSTINLDTVGGGQVTVGTGIATVGDTFTYEDGGGVTVSMGGNDISLDAGNNASTFYAYGNTAGLVSQDSGGNQAFAFILDEDNIKLTSVPSGTTSKLLYYDNVNGYVTHGNAPASVDVSGKLNTSTFATYSASTQTSINSKLSTSTYSTYTGATNTRLNLLDADIANLGAVSAITASNGLTRTGNQIRLGGTVSSNVSIDPATAGQRQLFFGNGGNGYSFIGLYATNTSGANTHQINVTSGSVIMLSPSYNIQLGSTSRMRFEMTSVTGHTSAARGFMFAHPNNPELTGGGFGIGWELGTENRWSGSLDYQIVYTGSTVRGTQYKLRGRRNNADFTFAQWGASGSSINTNFKLTAISAATKSNVLYYDTTTKVVSYGLAPSGGTGSGLAVAAFNTYSAATQTTINSKLATSVFASYTGTTSSVTAKNVTGTTYTFVTADAGKLLRFTHVSGCTATLPSGLTSGWYTNVVRVAGAGTLTLSAGSGATLESTGTQLTAEKTAASIYKTSSTAYAAFGAFQSYPVQNKTFLIEAPSSSENLTGFYTTEAITLIQADYVLRGASSPSVSFSVKYSNDRSDVSPSTATSRVATSTTTGQSVALSVNIPANRWVWLTTSATAGTVTDIAITLSYYRT
jgi:hypothetical protein